MNYRKHFWDYQGRGVYLLTMNVAERKPLLGQLQTDEGKAYITYTDLGIAVIREAERAFSQYPQLQICAKQIMPDHLHIVLWVKEQIPFPIGEIVRGFKIGCTHAYWETLHINVQTSNAYSNNHSAENIDTIEAPSKLSLFERGFHDRIMLRGGQLKNMVKYVHDNPRRLALRRANPDLFRIHQQVERAGLTFTTLGNQFLLDYPLKAVLQCSRSLSQSEIDERKADCLWKASKGVVFVSASISEGEKQICRAVREAGYPLIILLQEGFPKPDSEHYKYFKPSGVYFEACAAGKLLLLEPQAFVFEQPQIVQQAEQKAGAIPHDTKRYRFLALNAVAAQLCS